MQEKWIDEDGYITIRTFFPFDEISEHQRLVDEKRYLDKFKDAINMGKILLDFELVVEGKSIKAFKFVLMAQSTVFSAMILSDLKEARQGKVIIEGMCFKVMHQLVEFMHHQAKGFDLVV